MTLKNKSILVTGGAGFIGSHLIDEIVIEDPENVVVVDNLFLGNDKNLLSAFREYPNLKIYHNDASKYDEIKKILHSENIDVVFDLAVIPLPTSLERPAWTFRHNTDITLSMCELLREGLYKTLIHFSSSEVYGTSIYAPMDENHPLNGTTSYAASKAASDLLLLSYCRVYGVDASIIRPFNNYGPRQNEGSYAGVIPITVNRIIKGEAPIIYGDGNQTRDYLYVTDTAKAALNIYKSNKTRGRVLNIASGREVSINHLIHTIAKLMNCTADVIYGPERPGDVRRHIANIFLSEDLIGFHPTIGFEEGLKATIRWYLERRGSAPGKNQL